MVVLIIFVILQVAVACNKQNLPLIHTAECQSTQVLIFIKLTLYIGCFPSAKNLYKNFTSKNKNGYERFLFWMDGEKREKGLRVLNNK